MFDLISQKSDIVNINAKYPKPTRNSDLVTITNLYEASMKSYLKTKGTENLASILYNAITNLDSDNESNKSNNEQVVYTATNTNPGLFQNTNTGYTDTSISSNTTNSVLTTNKPPNTNTVPRPSTPTNQIT